MLPAQVLSKGERAVAAARSYLGTPYKWGGTSHSGIDCSGLVQRGWFEGTGLLIPRTTVLQFAALPFVSKANLIPGDLLFYLESDGGVGPGHVTMYLGGGRIIQSAHSGTVVSEGAVWWGGFAGARRPGGGRAAPGGSGGAPGGQGAAGRHYGPGGALAWWGNVSNALQWWSTP